MRPANSYRGARRTAAKKAGYVWRALPYRKEWVSSVATAFVKFWPTPGKKPEKRKRPDILSLVEAKGGG